MATVAEIYQTMEYGVAPESSKPARDWIAEREGKFGLFIGGEWQTPASGEYFDTINPATGKPLAQVAQAGAADIEAAVAVARKAQAGWWEAGGHGMGIRWIVAPPPVGGADAGEPRKPSSVSQANRVAVIPLGPALPPAASNLPGNGPPTRRRRSGTGSPQVRSPIWSCSAWGFPCLRRRRRSGALLPHHFTLTAAPKDGGGIFSVALSVASPRLAVGEHAARGSSDFPPRAGPWAARSNRLELSGGSIVTGLTAQ